MIVAHETAAALQKFYTKYTIFLVLSKVCQKGLELEITSMQLTTIYPTESN